MEEREKPPSSLAPILSELSPEVLSTEDVRQSAINLIGLFKLLSEINEQQKEKEVNKHETKHTRRIN